MSELAVEALQARIRELEQRLAQYKLDLMVAEGNVQLAQIQIDGMARTWQMIEDAQRRASSDYKPELIGNRVGSPAR